MMEAKRLIGLATQWLLARVLRYDLMLLTIVMCLITVGFITLFSAGYSFPWRIEDQMRNIIVALTAMFIVSFVPIRWVRKVSVAAFAAGCLLLLATELVGVTVKGATRWLDIGVRIQPSEIMKLAVPMMLAWYYWKRAEQTVWWDHLLALAILSVPVAFILKQPDLGTAILVSIAGLAVIFFAGINAKLVTACCAIGIALMPLLWTMLHDYQRERILTLIDPTLDPLGKGFHTLQALIAIGRRRVWFRWWGAFAHPISQSHCQKLLHRRSCTISLRSTFGSCHWCHFLYLFLRQHRHGERHTTCSGSSTAFYELRWYSTPHSWHLHRNSAQHLCRCKRLIFDIYGDFHEAALRSACSSCNSNNCRPCRMQHAFSLLRQRWSSQCRGTY